MKKALTYWFAFLVLLLWMTSCKSTKPVVITNTKTEKVIERVHDTVFNIAADSSSYRALLDCQNGKVVIKDVFKNTAGKHLTAPSVRIIDNQLEVDCFAEAQKLFAQWISKDVYTALTEQTPIYIEYQPTWWERFLIGFSKLSLILSTIWFVVWIVKKQITAYGLKK
jgi:hypothetical protein